MSGRTVILFGAGATRACGGPLTNEILQQAFDPTVCGHIEREDYMALLDEFLVDNFHVPRDSVARVDSDYPGLPLLISLVDKALDKKQPMGPNWSVGRLQEVRRALQYVIFALLEYKLRHLSHDHYLSLLQVIDPARTAPPTLISLNYDIIADNAMVGHYDCLPDYGCDITTPSYRSMPHAGELLKIHGSLNWSYCPGCDRLELGVAKSGRTYKMLEDLYQVNPLEARYSCHGFPCPDCRTFVEPILITPTQAKDYRNPHVASVWTRAERALREAVRVIVVGYSLPDDDLDVIYLLKRGLGALASEHPERITVVERAAAGASPAIGQHPVGRRYRTLFGPRIDWRTDGFESLVDSLRRDAGAMPLSPAPGS